MGHRPDQQDGRHGRHGAEDDGVAARPAGDEGQQEHRPRAQAGVEQLGPDVDQAPRPRLGDPPDLPRGLRPAQHHDRDQPDDAAQNRAAEAEPGPALAPGPHGHQDQMSDQARQRDQVEQSDGGQGERVTRPSPRAAGTVQGPQQQQRGQDHGQHHQGIGAGLVGEAAHARDQGEQQTGGQSRAVAEQPPPDQRDTAGGTGHGQRRGHAQGEGRVTEDARPGVQDQVVRAQYPVHPLHRGQHLADAAAGHVPARQLVAAEQRFADPVHRQDESDHRRTPPQTDRRRLPVAVLCFAGRIVVRARGGRGESCHGESHSGAAARASAVTRPLWAASPVRP